MDQNTINNNFVYHAPKGDQTTRYQELRDAAKHFAEVANRLTPQSREQSIGFTNLEQAMFWFNAAIARNE